MEENKLAFFMSVFLSTHAEFFIPQVCNSALSMQIILMMFVERLKDTVTNIVRAIISVSWCTLLVFH